MDDILLSIAEEYDRLLKYYENMYDNFKNADTENLDQYIGYMEKNSSYILPILECQKRIEDLRGELGKSIKNEILIDNVVDGFSGGRIAEINDRIGHIIDSIKYYGMKGKAALEEEMKKIENDFEDIDVSGLLES